MKHSLVDKQLSNPIALNTIQCEVWMSRLIRRADEIGALGEVPVSAVVLNQTGHCIGHGSNQREKEKDPLAHAEIIALKQASLIRNDWRFNDCTLIVTLEPCPMCAGALIQARMGQVIFGATDLKKGALGSVLDLSKDKSAHHYMNVKGGILGEEIGQELKSWFKLQRRLLI